MVSQNAGQPDSTTALPIPTAPGSIGSPSSAPAADLQAGLLADDDQRTWESRELLGGKPEVRIRHGADCYRLRLTQNGKLILQK